MEKVKCWEVFKCKEKVCPAYKSHDLKCWLFSGTHCRNEIQGKFLEKIEMCLGCDVFKKNTDVASIKATLSVVNRQFREFRKIIQARDKELENIGLEMALGLSEVFEALKKISSGDPTVRIPEKSRVELISKLKHIVNITAEEIGEIVDQSHEFAMGLAEHFDVLHKVSTGDLNARVSGKSDVELLEALKKVMNNTIVSISREINQRKRTEAALQKAHNELEQRVEGRTAELTAANKKMKQEIVERRRVEEALRESEIRFRRVTEAAFEGLAVTEWGRLIDVTGKLAKLFGYERSELIGKSIAELIAPNVRNDTLTKILSGYSLPYESICLKKDKTIFPVEVCGKNYSSKGRVLCVTAIRDITRRKMAEKVLQESESKYKTLTENSLTGIFIHQKGKFIFVNDKFAEMHGYKPGELLRKSHLLLVHPDEKKTLKEFALKRLEGKSVPQQYEVRRITKQGKTIWCEMMATLIQYKGKPAIMGNVIDITERKLAEVAIKESEEQLRNLTTYLQKIGEVERTNIAREIHDELGLGLTVLKIDLSWLRKRLPENEIPLHEKAETMIQLIDKTIQTVKKISTELRPGLLDDLGLAAAIEWQAEEFQKRTGIQCKITIDPKDVTFDRDRNTAIYRIFQETLTNVARHAQATEVDVSLRQRDVQLELIVRDNGRGITEKELANPRSFGLIGIRERVKIFSGINIIKGVPGKGTTVTVRMPIRDIGENR
ncbi:MAG: PAS domain S-box protein [Thermodesulfovibrionales bacterium]